MKPPGQFPIPTFGYPSRQAAVRAYDVKWPGAPAVEVAWMLGCAARDVWLARGQDRCRGGLKPRQRSTRTSAQATRERRERYRLEGLCTDCGDPDERPLPGKVRCEGCLEHMRNRSKAYRVERA